MEQIFGRLDAVQKWLLKIKYQTSSSAMAERPHKLSDFKGMGHFEANF